MTSNLRFKREIEDEAGGSSRLRWLLVTLVGLSGLLLVVWWPGCKQYPEVSSAEGLRLIRMLYTACNTRSAERLAKVAQEVERAIRAGKLTPGEQAAFQDIMERAKQGDWKAAEKASFKFAKDQVR